MINIDQVRETLWNIEHDTGAAHLPAVDPVIAIARNAIDELEALRKPVAPCRFDVKAARGELARIDAAWYSTEPAAQHGAFHDSRALLDRALAAIDAGWPAPVAITDAVVEKAGQIAYGAWDREPIITARGFEMVARAVLEYAASLGGVAPAPVVDTSQRMTIPMRHPLAGKCAADRLTDYRCAYIIRGFSREDVERAAQDTLAAERTPANG